MERKIKELEIRSEKLDQDIKEFFKNSGISQEEFSKYSKNKENFTEDEWTTLENIRKDLDAKLETSLNSIHNPQETSKKFKERNIDNRWIFVR